MCDTKNSQGDMGSLQQDILHLTGTVETETKRLADCLKTQKSRYLKLNKPEAYVGVQNGVGLRRSKYWVSEDDPRAGTIHHTLFCCFSAFENIMLIAFIVCTGMWKVSHLVMRSIIAEIQEAGFITLQNALLQCGPAYSSNGQSLKKFLLDNFPIISYHAHQSPVTVLVDGLNPPDEVLRSYFESRDSTSMKGKHGKKQKPGNKSEPDAEAGEASKIEKLHKFIEDEDSRLAALCNAEFATEDDLDVREKLQFCFPRGASHSTSSIVSPG